MLNRFSVMDTQMAYTRYYSLNVFDESVPYIPMAIGFFTVLAVDFSALAAIAFCGTQGAVKIKTKQRIKLPSAAIPMSCRTLLGAEMSKMMLTNKFSIIVAVPFWPRALLPPRPSFIRHPLPIACTRSI